MKRLLLFLSILFSFTIAACAEDRSSASSRRPDRKNSRSAQNEQNGHEGRPGGRNPFESLKTADGKIDLSKLTDETPERMKTELQKADADKDGFLDENEQKEIPFFNRRGGPGGPEGQGGPGFGRPGGRNPFESLKTADGKIDLSKLTDETPERMKTELQKADVDKDGFLDENEQKEIPFFNRRGGPGGPEGQGGPGDRPRRDDRNGRGRNEKDRSAKSKKGYERELLRIDGAVPNDQFCAIPANPDFRFARPLSGKDEGEWSGIHQAYALGRYPVTNAEYSEFIKATGRTELPGYWKNGAPPEGRENHPVVEVTLADAADYCEWLSTQNPGWTFRLPTEAEWENAASGPDQFAYPWGTLANLKWNGKELAADFNCNTLCASEILDDPDAKPLKINSTGMVTGWKTEGKKSGFCDTERFRQIADNGGATTPVDRFRENYSVYGCADMAGNSFDWTATEIVAAVGAEKGEKVNAIRGGSWYSMPKSCSSTARGEGRDGKLRYNNVGFRVAAVRAEEKK